MGKGKRNNIEKSIRTGGKSMTFSGRVDSIEVEYMLLKLI